MRKNSTFKKFLGVMPLAILLLGYSELKAQEESDFTFGLDKFTVVDNTKKVLLPNGSFVANGNTYTLTGQSVRNQSIAMWHHQ